MHWIPVLLELNKQISKKTEINLYNTNSYPNEKLAPKFQEIKILIICNPEWTLKYIVVYQYP